MIRFQPQARQAAAILGLTEEDLTNCIRHPELEECRRRLDSLRTLLKQRYREAALNLHPDRTGNDPEKTELFKRVTHLWEEIQKLEIGPRPRPRPQPMPGVVIVVSGSGGFRNDTTSTNTTTSWGGWTTWR